jgi:ATP-binding cassette subfamily B protein
MDYVKLSAMLTPVIRLKFGASFALVIIFGSTLVVEGVITLGDFVAMNSYLLMLVMPMTRLSRTVEIWQRAFASIKRLDEILLVKSEINDAAADPSITKAYGDIVFKDLSFTYPMASAYPNTNPRALTKIDLTVKKGQTLGIIGSMGSGKSTLCSLLLRLYLIEPGKLAIDGHNINNIPLKTLRKTIGYADSFMFAATIMENIKFFDDSVTEAQAIEAAKLAGVYDNIMELSNQFETVIGERGITLSGGQKQRIGIARAIAKNPDILILDDSLSAVDTQTEEEIIANLKKILADKTGIIAAHRVSSIKYADLIIYMDKGRIIESGTHEELLALKGEYYKLDKLQSLEGEIGETV